MVDPIRRALVQMQGVFSELDKSLVVKKLKNGREKAREKSTAKTLSGERTFFNWLLVSSCGLSHKEAGAYLGNSEEVNRFHYMPVSLELVREKMRKAQGDPLLARPFFAFGAGLTSRRPNMSLAFNRSY